MELVEAPENPDRAASGNFDAGPHRHDAAGHGLCGLISAGPALGMTLPATMAEHEGAVIFGGPMSANDNEPWIAREIDWIGVPLKEQKPFLGVCLGAQMLSMHLGGQSRPARRRAG